jgi:hypothetical protein
MPDEEFDKRLSPSGEVDYESNRAATNKNLKMEGKNGN